MTPLCRIQWIDDDGNPTPDDNPAIGYVRCFGYPIELNPSYKPEPSRWYPICKDHLAKMPLDGYWEFVRDDPCIQ